MLLVPHRDIPEPGSGTEHGTEPQVEALQAPVDTKEPTEAPQLVLVFSSTSPDEALVTPAVSPLQDNHKAYQNLLKWVVSNLGVQVEMVKEVTHSLLDILSPAGLSRIALQLNDAIMDPWHVALCGKLLPSSSQQQSAQNANILFLPRDTNSFS